MFEYDAANRLVTKTDPEGNVFQYEYYADGKLKNETYTVNATPTTTHYDYNALGHLETKTLGYGSGNTRVFNTATTPCEGWKRQSILKATMKK
ncbi:MAG: RHS repeat protein [Planctomycetes bacterium]|nr:RHS repeat protein [Planctomycetota bacterium]